MKLAIRCGCALAAFMSFAIQAEEPTSCMSPRFAKIGWADLESTTALAKNILVGIGYKPTDVTLSIPLAWAGLKRKNIDIYLGYWKPSQDANAKPYLDSNSVTQLPTPNLTGAKFTLAVPSYAYESGLRSFDDIAKFKDKLGGKIYGIEPGDDANVVIQKMIKGNEHNLGDFKLIESSEAGMLVSIQRAVSRKEWIVFLGWEPHPMNLSYKIQYLSGGDKEFGPNYGSAEVYTVVANGYQERCPNVAKLLDNLKFDVSMEDEIMARVVKKEDPMEVTKEWLKDHPEVVAKWLEGVTTFSGEPAQQKIMAYLGL
ncbi:choline ABC transporter substrate-binding protein [Pseudomonas sp. BN411]|nr:choline ABC transporter substrate-binding protein [Pseudomonas sp. BN411]